MRSKLDNLPYERLDSVLYGFSNADKRVLEVIGKISRSLKINRCEKYLNSNGEYITEISHFSEVNNSISMDESKDDEEYVITFCHEYGHYIDASLNRPSLQEDFMDAINAEADHFDPNSIYGLESLNEMLRNLKESDVMNSRYFSDILSALFHNDQRIIDVYYNEGMPFYHHTNDYWDGIAGPPQAPQREIFANLFAIYTENDAEVVHFTEKYLPNIVSRFNKLIGGFDL